MKVEDPAKPKKRNECRSLAALVIDKPANNIFGSQSEAADTGLKRSVVLKLYSIMRILHTR